MKTPEEIKKGLECCSYNMNDCNGCPYDGMPCNDLELERHALEYIQQLETREWELFDLLSSAWHGKGCYFKQDDGTVYSRATCQYLSFDQAIDEFESALTNAHEVE